MTRSAVNVAALLDDVCRWSNVSPADPSPESGSAVLAFLLRNGLKDRKDAEFGCPIADWVSEWSGVENLLVTDTRVLLVHRVDGAAKVEFVPLPEAWVACVKLRDQNPHAEAA